VTPPPEAVELAGEIVSADVPDEAVGEPRYRG
jgi:hypothetical protein